MKLFSVAFILCCLSSLSAQDFNNYKRVTNTGLIPVEFLTLSADKYKSDLKNNPNKGTVLEKNARKDFYLESNFLINELFQSGKILFNDSMGAYVGKIADVLLKSEPGIRKQLRFYVILSDIPNAYTTDNGSIFFTVGLLAKMENEAQLAFVIAHEITHYRKKHVINGYIENVRIDEESGISGQKSAEERMLAKANYSQDQETEADMEGLKLFLLTDYPASEAARALEILKYENLPFLAPFSFQAGVLSTGAFIFHNAADSVGEPDFKEEMKYEEVDKFSSHPALDDRIRKISEAAGLKEDDKEKAVEPSDGFLRMRKTARFELCRLLLIKGEYIQAIYSASILKKEEGSSVYLDETIAKALYGYCLHKFNHLYSYNTEKNLSASAVKVKDFLDSFSRKEMILFAVSYNYSCYKNKNSAAWKKRSIELLQLLHYEQDFIKTGFHADSLEFYAANDTTGKGFYRELSRLSRDEQYVKLNEYSKQPAAERTMIKAPVADKRGEVAMGVDTLLVLDPFYFRLQPLKDDEQPIRFIASEKSMLKYNDYIVKSGKRMNMRIEMLSPVLMGDTSTSRFNEMAQVKSYLEELEEYDQAEMVSVDQEELDAICTKYNTTSFALLGEVSVHTHRKKAGLIILSIIVWPTLPLGIIYAFSPSYDSFNYVAVYDIDHGKRYENVHRMRQRDSRAAVNAALYYNLLQIHAK